MVHDLIERLIKTAEISTTKLRVRSAINPCLWISAFAILSGLGGVISTNPPVQYWMVGMMFSFPSICMVSFLWFSFTDPDKLRSEEYELRKKALTVVEEKGGAIQITGASVEAIANLHYPPSLKNEGDAR